MRNEIQDLRDDGFPVGVVDMSGSPPAKYPTGVNKWQNLPAIKNWPHYEIEGCFIRTGEIEVVDVDSKHWKEEGDFAQMFDDSLRILPFYDKLVYYQTISGGRQYPYWTNAATGSKKLAIRLASKEAVLETRGKGGLAVCPPTKGYEWKEGGEWDAIPRLSDTERNQFIEHCRGWNEGVDEEEVDISEAKSYKENLGRPGDDWASKNDFIAYIKGQGWAVERVAGECVLLRRPGKESGCSASWNYKGLGRFYCWSSSAGLPTEKMLKPFAVKAYMEHEGDFKACALELHKQGYGNEALAIVEACGGCKNWGEVGGIIKENSAKLQKADLTDLSLGLQALGIKGVTESKIKALTTELKKGEVVEWSEELTYDEDQKVKGKIYNLDLILRNDPQYKDVFFYDDFGQRIVIKGKSGNPIDFDDRFMARLRVRLGQEYGSFRPEDIDAVVMTIASENHFHPLQEKIKSLEWDGVKRVDTWLTKYCGADDSKYSRIVGKKWLISAIARLFRPGCKVDNMLILEGEQGTNKSSTLRTLSYGNFLDGSIDIRNKDGLMALFGKWIVEFSELEGMNGRTAEQIKAFLVKQEDMIRRPYAKKEEVFRRTCVFAGTTNKTHYLEDDKNRRFWPITCKKVDLAELEADRDNLWAEAYQLFRSGESWWIDEESDEANEVRAEQGGRVNHDEMAHGIMDFTQNCVLDNGQIFFKMEDVWRDVYFGKISQLDRRKQLELAATLRKLGFRKVDFRLKGVRYLGWSR